MITQILKTGVTIALITLQTLKAEPTIYIIEPFSCEVALADLADLQKHLEIEPRTSWRYEIFLLEYEAVSNALNGSDCEVK